MDKYFTNAPAKAAHRWTAANLQFSDKVCRDVGSCVLAGIVAGFFVHDSADTVGMDQCKCLGPRSCSDLYIFLVGHRGRREEATYLLRMTCALRGSSFVYLASKVTRCSAMSCWVMEILKKSGYVVVTWSCHVVLFHIMSYGIASCQGKIR